MAIHTEAQYQAALARLEHLTLKFLHTPDGREDEDEVDEIYRLFDEVDDYEFRQRDA